MRSEKVSSAQRKAGIVKVAGDLLAKGDGQLSARRLTSELGLSTKVVYTHFDNMDGVIASVFEMYFLDLAAMLARSDPKRGDVRERLIAVAQAYRRWALDNAEVFDLLYGLKAARLMPEPEDRAAARHSLDAFARIWMDQGESEENAINMAYAAWTTIHGSVALEVSGWLEGSASFEAALDRITSTNPDR